MGERRIFDDKKGHASSRDTIRGGTRMKTCIVAFATVALLAAAVYAQSVEKASKRVGGEQQTEQQKSADG
jgi:hypothetical protein